MVSLILNGKRPLKPWHAIRAEQVSGGFFRADDLLPDTVFTRNEAGEAIGWHVQADDRTHRLGSVRARAIFRPTEVVEEP